MPLNPNQSINQSSTVIKPDELCDLTNAVKIKSNIQKVMSVCKCHTSSECSSCEWQTKPFAGTSIQCYRLETQAHTYQYQLHKTETTNFNVNMYQQSTGCKFLALVDVTGPSGRQASTQWARQTP